MHACNSSSRGDKVINDFSMSSILPCKLYTQCLLPCSTAERC
ncbi:hypothetical protein HID58_018369 [Brassica napus]|uniref:Uncharacterized protein n=1 Tax=Brassica napus TaxID=3708 RepID=A0ABQ8D9S5_BRANA|nr:hypothetical protein HID58_018369 [Brassica napus]